MVGAEHARLILQLANEQDEIENSWLMEARRLHYRILESITKSLKKTGRAQVPEVLINEFLFDHYFAVASEAAHTAQREMDLIVDKSNLHLGKWRVPRSLKELRILYDHYRKTGKVPKPFRDMGEDIKKQYLKKTQSVWRKHAEDFRTGDEATQENVLRKVEGAADTVESRAKTIVRTETTNYYNNTRREIFDQTDAVSHYLFLAIRDQATTQWCSDKVVGGKRGRHGLVYKKSDPLTAKETPACHWNCRSEMVPLTPFNPRHAKLIEDESLQRRNHRCTPLPKGWR